MVLQEGHSTSKILTFLNSPKHKLFRKHVIFKINNVKDSCFENFVIFRPLIIKFFRFGQIQKIFCLFFFCYGKEYYAQWASNLVEKWLPQPKKACISSQEQIWAKITKMVVARPLLLRIQNPLGYEVHLGQGFETCQNDPDPSPCPFLLLTTLQKNRHLNFLKSI